MSGQGGYHGVDLDATLAEYHGWQADGGIGEPIPAMVAQVKDWLLRGEEVRIITARAMKGGEGSHVPEMYGGQPISVPELDVDQVTKIHAWCLEHIGVVLPVQFWKCYRMIDLWDDRAVSVVPNTGRRMVEYDDLSGTLKVNLGPAKA